MFIKNTVGQKSHEERLTDQVLFVQIYSGAYSRLQFLRAVSHSLSTLMRSPYSRVSTAAQQQQQRGRGQSGASSDDVSGVGISNSGSCISL